MKVDRISYAKSFEMVDSIGLKTWEKIGFEAEIQDGDIYSECLDELRMEVDSYHKRDKPANGNYFIQDPRPPMVVTPSTKDERIQSFIATINMCTSLKFLRNFQQRVAEEKNEELTIAYQKKEHDLMLNTKDQ